LLPYLHTVFGEFICRCYCIDTTGTVTIVAISSVPPAIPLEVGAVTAATATIGASTGAAAAAAAAVTVKEEEGKDDTADDTDDVEEESRVKIEPVYIYSVPY